MDTFLTESARKQIAERLLVATTNLIGHKAKQAIDGQEKPVHTLLLRDLERADIEWPSHTDKLRPSRPRRKVPRPHQRRAVADVMRGLRKVPRGQLIMACGTGKSLVGLWVAEALRTRRTVVLVPSLSLLSQSLGVWAANAKQRFRFLCVCSDETVAADDGAVARTCELPFPVTTDPDQIANFLRQTGRQVIFATYQSSQSLVEAQKRRRVPALDLAIADEAHRCAGQAGTAFTAILDEEQIRARYRLFMTATPRYITGRLKREVEGLDVEVVSMDDHALFGPEFHRLTFARAIEDGLLSDYQVVVVVVDNETYLDYAAKGTYVTLDGEQVRDARTVGGQIGLAKAMRKYDLRRVVSFHSRVDWAKSFASSLASVVAWMPQDERPTGELWCEHVSGAMSAAQRGSVLDRLQEVDGRGLVSNARCLTEGIDVPALDGVAFVDPRRSEVDVVQAVGRAIRKSPEKKVGTIVLPVFIPAGADAEGALEDSAFKHVWQVLQALRAHDEVLAAQLDELRSQLGRRGSTDRLPGKITLIAPKALSIAFARAFDTKIIEHATSRWESWFGLLLRYVEEHGQAGVPAPYVSSEGLALGAWVSKQRTNRWRGTLSAERAARLEALPRWSWGPHEDAWEDGITHLKEFAGLAGHARPPQAYVSTGGFRLGSWVTARRMEYTRGLLARERVSQLEAFPGWSWDARQTHWDRMLGLLEAYVKAQNTAAVPLLYRTSDGAPLGHWVAKQRTRKNTGTMPPERIEKLERLPGWTWDAITDNWEQGFARLEEYVRQEGHALVPANHEAPDGFPLGRWVVTRRREKVRGHLDPRRAARFEELPGWSWHTKNDAWEKTFSSLCQCLDRQGPAGVSCDVLAADGTALGRWVGRQRRLYSRGRLAKERAARLESLPGWSWDSGDGAKSPMPWDSGFLHLAEYAEREGHARVPKSYVAANGFKLGLWLSEQRHMVKEGRLSGDRVAQLKRLPGWSLDVKSDLWDAAFVRLEEYANREGHSRVPQSYIAPDLFKLGAWVATQRQQWALRRLSARSVARLEGLPGWTWEAWADSWAHGLTRLAEYAAESGSSRVPRGYATSDGFRLGEWASNQRGKRAKGLLSPDRAAQLERLPGWTWNSRESAWEDAFARLQEFARREGHARVPRSYVGADGFKLGVWVSDQRHRQSGGARAAERAARLERLPGWSWEPKVGSWNDAFARLVGFVKREGHARVPRTHITRDGFKLGSWVVSQRQRQAKGSLAQVQATKLEELPGWSWRVHEDSWSEAYARLEAYVRREGHADMPDGHAEPDGFNLGSWVGKQRREHARGRLSNERVERLETLPGWSWHGTGEAAPRSQRATVAAALRRKRGIDDSGRWKTGYMHLERFVEREGHVRVPETYATRDGFALGEWVEEQRADYRRGGITKSHLALLNRLGDWR